MNASRQSFIVWCEFGRRAVLPACALLGVSIALSTGPVQPSHQPTPTPSPPAVSSPPESSPPRTAPVPAPAAPDATPLLRVVAAGSGTAGVEHLWIACPIEFGRVGVFHIASHVDPRGKEDKASSTATASARFAGSFPAVPDALAAAGDAFLAAFVDRPGPTGTVFPPPPPDGTDTLRARAVYLQDRWTTVPGPRLESLARLPAGRTVLALADSGQLRSALLANGPGEKTGTSDRAPDTRSVATAGEPDPPRKPANPPALTLVVLASHEAAWRELPLPDEVLSRSSPAQTPACALVSTSMGPALLVVPAAKSGPMLFLGTFAEATASPGAIITAISTARDSIAAQAAADPYALESDQEDNEGAVFGPGPGENPLLGNTSTLTWQRIPLPEEPPLGLANTDAGMVLATRTRDASFIRLYLCTGDAAHMHDPRPWRELGDFAVPSSAGPVTLAGGGQTVSLLWRSDTEPGTNQLPVQRIAVSAWTGRELARGGFTILGPASRADYRFVAIALTYITGLAAIILLRPREDPGVWIVPEGWEIAQPWRRFCAGLIDALLAFFAAGLLVGLHPREALTTPAIALLASTSGQALLLATLGLGALSGTILEATIGRSLGKMLVGCVVCDVARQGLGPLHEVPENARGDDAPRLLPLHRALVRNMVKWFLPPAGIVGAMGNAARHRGDEYAGAAVLTRTQLEES